MVYDLNLVIGDIRRYIIDLRPTELQGRRLEEALASLVGYLEDRAAVSVTADLALDSLPAGRTLFRKHLEYPSRIFLQYLEILPRP